MPAHFFSSMSVAARHCRVLCPLNLHFRPACFPDNPPGSSGEAAHGSPQARFHTEGTGDSVGRE